MSRSYLLQRPKFAQRALSGLGGFHQERAMVSYTSQDSVQHIKSPCCSTQLEVHIALASADILDVQAELSGLGGSDQRMAAVSYTSQDLVQHIKCPCCRTLLEVHVALASADILDVRTQSSQPPTKDATTQTESTSDQRASSGMWWDTGCFTWTTNWQPGARRRPPDTVQYATGLYGRSWL